MDLDDLQRELGGISRHQILSVFAICLATIPSGPVWGSGAFLSAVPDHRCKLPDGFENTTLFNETEILQLVNKTSCSRYDYNYSACSNNMTIECLTTQDTVDMIDCDDGYVYSDQYYQETTISEWDLVCNRRTLDSLANSLFFVGFFLGSAFCGLFSDWYGRKYSYLAFSLLMVAFNIITRFVPWFELYLVFRVLAAATTVAQYLTGFTLATELIPTSYRVTVSMIIFITNTAAGLVLVAFAYALREWRMWYLVMATFGIPLLLLIIVMPESPRWLLVNNRSDEAKIFMQKCFKSKNRVFDEDKWDEVARTEMKKVEADTTTTNSSYLDLFRRPLTRLVTFNVIFCWFTISMVNYGLLLNVTTLAGDPYLNATINNLMSIAGNFSVLLCHKFDRTHVQSFGFFGAGTCCLLSMILSLTAGEDNQAQTTASVAMALTGKLFTTLTFSLVYIVTAEAYPTCVRATGMSIGSMGARVGSMIMPFTLQLQYQVPWLTQTIFGVLSVLAGFTTFAFPETKDVDYISTLAEAEAFYASNMKKTAKLIRIRKNPVTPIDGINNKAMDDISHHKI